MDSTVSVLANVVRAASGWVKSALEVPFARAVIFEVNIGGHLFVEGLLLEVYSNLYYLLAQSEELNATDKWAGFVLTKEGEEFVQQNANLIKYDLIYNLLRLESWQKLANIYAEEVDLLLNDESKQINVLRWRKNAVLSERVEASRRRSRRCLLMTLALAKTADQQVSSL